MYMKTIIMQEQLLPSRCRRIATSTVSSAAQSFAFVFLFLASRSFAFQSVHSNSGKSNTMKQLHRARLDAKKKSATTTTATPVTEARQNRVRNLMDWCDRANIKISKQVLSIRYDDATGLGLYCTGKIPSKSIVMTVPADVALSVEFPGEGPNNRVVFATFGNEIKNMPWFAQMSLYLNTLKRQQNEDYKHWIDSLPNKFTTPFHWSSALIEELQYEYLADAVKRQQNSWKNIFDSIASKPSLSYQDFVWGCECARSRAFSGSYTGSAFNPALYAFVLLLVTIYVGLNVGTLEQAANGAGVVVCASILKDFVLPKIFKKKRFVICPMIDVVNHRSANYQGDVAFEYFSNGYSLSISNNADEMKPNDQLFISYGTRSNDQLLQYYGFVEANNPHDVYVMPPLKDWDISAIEIATGRRIEHGRLSLLNKAGILGAPHGTQSDDGSGDFMTSQIRGVLLSGVTGVDPATMQALRVLLSTKEEWKANGENIGTFSTENSGGKENEQCARIAAKTAIKIELASKPTTIQEDVDALNQNENFKGMSVLSNEEINAFMFRIEKKKVLQKCINLLN
jgi:Rubisco LSMT substrate-binding